MMGKASALLGLVCLPLVFVGCARDADPKTYAIPRATAAEFKIVVCPAQRAEPATAVACPETNK